jgi:transposase
VAVREKESEKRDLSNFDRAHIVGMRLAETSLIKTTTLLGVSRATVSKVLSAAYKNNGKTTSAKRNSGRKSTLTERDRRTLRRIVSKNHRTIAAQVNCCRTEDLFPHKLSTSASQIQHPR